MTDEPDGETSPQTSTEAAAREAARRKRRAEVFGEVLPEGTRDDRPDGGEGDGTDEWLRQQVPPHHG